MNRHIERHEAKGFSLIELMISMVLGLLVVAGTIGLYSSLTGVAASKQGVDLAQETQRSVHTTLLRLVRQADQVGSESDQDEVVLHYTMREGMRDCRGQGPEVITPGTAFSQRISLSESHQLICNPDHGDPVVIADAITDFSIYYAAPQAGLILHDRYDATPVGATALRFFFEVDPSTIEPLVWGFTASLRPNQEGSS